MMAEPEVNGSELEPRLKALDAVAGSVEYGAEGGFAAAMGHRRGVGCGTGVSSSSIGRPRASVKAWILVPSPPRCACSQDPKSRSEPAGHPPVKRRAACSAATTQSHPPFKIRQLISLQNQASQTKSLNHTSIPAGFPFM